MARAEKSPTADAVEPLDLDLATLPVDQVTTRPGGRDAYYRIKLFNIIPGIGPYQVDIDIEEVAIQPLEFPGRPTEKRAGDVADVWRSAAPACTALLKKIRSELEAAKTEIKVKVIGDDAKRNAPAGCDVAGLVDGLTTQEVDMGKAFHVKASETLTITITRPGGDAKWIIKLPGTPRGEWRTSYGFFFVPDRDEKWFTEKDGTTFKIMKQEDREEFDFVPTILFTFLPTSKRGKVGVHGLTAGLGYDLEKPFVFGGYSFSYNENVIFSAGLAFHRQSRLLGRYKGKGNDVVSDALEPAQLVEDTYGPNIYVGIGFRFGDDIHARRNELAKESAKAAADATAARAKAAQAEKEAAIRKAECEARADAAEAAAKAKCTDDACRKVAEAEAAAAKAKCPLTELERAKAEVEARAKQEAADAAKKAKRDLCEKAAKSAFDAAVLTCQNEACKAAAKAKLDESMLKCAD